MARTGFYAIESGRISFRHDGRWYSDEEPIQNPRIEALFSRSIRRAADGLWYLQVGDERAPITVEDTPYVIRTIEDGPDGSITLLLNDWSREQLDPSTLEVGPANVLYCCVKGGEFRARFLRPAYYHLSSRFESDTAGFHIVLNGTAYPIKVRS
jgi:hypothetical protein